MKVKEEKLWKLPLLIELHFLSKLFALSISNDHHSGLSNHLNSIETLKCKRHEACLFDDPGLTIWTFITKRERTKCKEI